MVWRLGGTQSQSGRGGDEIIFHGLFSTEILSVPVIRLALLARLYTTPFYMLQVAVFEM
jgi:hypothetical protein